VGVAEREQVDLIVVGVRGTGRLAIALNRRFA